jgi:hypothetical protein
MCLQSIVLMPDSYSAYGRFYIIKKFGIDDILIVVAMVSIKAICPRNSSLSPFLRGFFCSSSHHCRFSIPCQRPPDILSLVLGISTFFLAVAG